MISIMNCRFTLLHEETIEFQSFGLRNNVAQFCVLKVRIPVNLCNLLNYSTCMINDAFNFDIYVGPFRLLGTRSFSVHVVSGINL